MPRRIPDYADAFTSWNYISSVGSIISLGSTVLFGYILYDMFAQHQTANSNPWSVGSYYLNLDEEIEFDPNTNTLEWALPNPMGLHNYPVLPIQS
jgi:heme/copper-type cytochrome/quinol oxidase subunit 1